MQVNSGLRGDYFLFLFNKSLQKLVIEFMIRSLRLLFAIFNYRVAVTIIECWMVILSSDNVWVTCTQRYIFPLIIIICVIHWHINQQWFNIKQIIITRESLFRVRKVFSWEVEDYLPLKRVRLFPTTTRSRDENKKHKRKIMSLARWLLTNYSGFSPPFDHFPCYIKKNLLRNV